ncbi:MAG: hypothetical protein Q8L85_09400 [Alphaproteobacteria bacterium]|nr:hypothetical protein [Alphaproteobacteria bacterium]MDP3533647.1 hypothetical protein [Alphaproteobacteria bacterium]
MLKKIYVFLVIAFITYPIAYALENSSVKLDQVHPGAATSQEEGRKAVIVTRTTINVVELTPTDDNKSFVIKEIHKIVEPGIIKDPSVKIDDDKLKVMLKKAFDDHDLKQGDAVTLGVGADLGDLVGTGAGLVEPVVKVATFVIPKIAGAADVVIGLAKNLLAFL